MSIKSEVTREMVGFVSTYDKLSEVFYLDLEKLATSVELGDGLYILLLDAVKDILDATNQVEPHLEIFNLIVWTTYMEMIKFFDGEPAFEQITAEVLSEIIPKISSEALFHELFLVEEYFETFTPDSLPENGIKKEQFDVSFLAIFYAYGELSGRLELAEYQSDSLIIEYLRDLHSIAESRGDGVLDININLVVEDIRRRLEKREINLVV